MHLGWDELWGDLNKDVIMVFFSDTKRILEML